MSLIDDDNLVNSAEITSEKNLFHAFLKSLSLPKDIFNTISTLSLFIILSIYIVLTTRENTKIIQDIQKLAETGFAFSSSILGFLIAGFSIFSAVSDPKLFVMMSKTIHRQSNLNYLKYNFLNFIYIFTLYFILILSTFMISILSQTNGVLSTFIKFIYRLNPCSDIILFKAIVVKTTFVLLFSFTYYCILLLKDFIFNVYHLFMTNIRWEAEREEDKV